MHNGLMSVYYYIAGSDGSGKTTLLKDLEIELNKKGCSTRHVWIRSPKILSKPLMAYCRLIGLIKYTTIGGVEYCKRELFRSRFVSYIFPILQLIDFKIKWYFQKIKINMEDTVLFDRFSLDTLADLMVDTKRMDLHKSWIGREFLRLVPEHNRIIILKADEEVIRKRKLDTLYDEQLKDKIMVYKLLSEDLSIKLIENNMEYLDVKNQVIKYMLYGKI